MEVLEGFWEEGREQRAPEEELERVFKAAIEKSFEGGIWPCRKDSAV